MAAGNKHLGYKEALNAIEATSPGTKHDFYFGFLARAVGALPARGRGRAGRPAALHVAAAHRPPPRSARSAASSSGPAATAPIPVPVELSPTRPALVPTPGAPA